MIQNKRYTDLVFIIKLGGELNLTEKHPGGIKMIQALFYLDNGNTERCISNPIQAELFMNSRCESRSLDRSNSTEIYNSSTIE